MKIFSLEKTEQSMKDAINNPSCKPENAGYSNLGVDQHSFSQGLAGLQYYT